MSKIVKLETTNVKRIKAALVQPDGSTVIVGGKNAQGKTSLLDSIAMALGGGKEIPDRPVRDGEKRAEIGIELDDGVKIVRTFNAKTGKTGLTITSPDGAKFPSPQKMLDDLVGKVSFDPLSFIRMDAKKQAVTLRELVGLDFSEIDGKRLAAFDKRTDVNREAKALQARIESIPEPDADVPDEEVSVSELTKELEAARDSMNRVDNARNAMIQAGNRVKNATADVERLRAELAEAEAELGMAKKEHGIVAAEFGKAEREVIDPANIRIALERAQGTNEKVRAKLHRAKLESELKEIERTAEELTDRIAECDEQKLAKLEEAQFPIEGLSFDEDGVSFKEVPLDQCSGAEQLRISVAVGMAMNPKLRVLLVRDGSLLDSDSLKAIADMATKNDAQVWIEKVADSKDGCTVFIEDGSIVE